MTSKSFEQKIIERIPLLQRLALKLTRSTHEAEDLVQETLLRALRHRDKFADGTHIEAWLYTILRNNYINYYRKQKNQRELNIGLTFRLRSFQQNLANEGLCRVLLKTILKKIEQLPAAYRKPLKLALAGYQYREIAETTGLPPGTVRSKIHLGKKLLKRLLQNVRY